MQLLRKILIMDNDIELRATLADQLALNPEFDVIQASNAPEAINYVKEFSADLIIMDGREALQLIRREGFLGPIIILSAYSADADAVTADFDAGADDYVLKPFRFAVLLARMRLHLRNNDASEDVVLKIGEYIFKLGSKHLICPTGARLRLTEKEVSILIFLYRAKGSVVTRDVLLKELWGYNSSVTTHTLETHIYRLRQKIELDPANAQILLTEGGGYKLTT